MERARSYLSLAVPGLVHVPVGGKELALNHCKTTFEHTCTILHPVARPVAPPSHLKEVPHTGRVAISATDAVCSM